MLEKDTAFQVTYALSQVDLTRYRQLFWRAPIVSFLDLPESSNVRNAEHITGCHSSKIPPQQRRSGKDQFHFQIRDVGQKSTYVWDFMSAWKTWMSISVDKSMGVMLSLIDCIVTKISNNSQLIKSLSKVWNKIFDLVESVQILDIEAELCNCTSSHDFKW